MVMAIIQTDIAQSIIFNKQAYQAIQASGYLGDSIANNLGVSYSQLGLYSRALRFYQKSLDMNPKSTTPLSNIVHIEIEQDELEHARQQTKNIKMRNLFGTGNVLEHFWCDKLVVDCVGLSQFVCCLSHHCNVNVCMIDCLLTALYSE